MLWNISSTLQNAILEGSFSAPPTTGKTSWARLAFPLIKKFVCDWIGKGLREGAEIMPDGRSVSVPGHKNGCYAGHTILDYITSEQSFFGDLHCHGKASFHFYMETKTIITRGFDDAEKKNESVDTWDGAISR